MLRLPTAVFTTLLVLACSFETALANKFETIGGGVSGMNQEKIAVLQQISAIAGTFFIFLGVVSFLTRNRFESLAALNTGKLSDSVNVAPIILTILGGILIGLYFL